MIWLGILSLVISLFLSFSKITAGFLLAILSTIIFKAEGKREAYIFSVIIASIIFLKILSVATIPFIVAIIITLTFLPVVNYLEFRLKIPRGISAFIIIIMLIGVILLFGYHLVNIFILEAQRIFENLKNIYNYFPENIRYQIELQIKSFSENIGRYLSQVFSVFLLLHSQLFFIS